MPVPEPNPSPFSKALSDFLTQHNLKPDQSHDDRGAAIHLAVLKREADVVNELLTLYRRDCVDAKDKLGRKKGRTPLHNAAQLGLHGIVKTLISNGADVNAKTRYKWTPLILAAGANRVEVVKLLLRHNVDVDAQAEAAFKGERNGLAAIHVAAELKSPTTLLQLLWHGAKTDVVTSDGDTPLHCAVTAKCAAASSFLLLHGASMIVMNKKGESPRDLIYELQGKSQRLFRHQMRCLVRSAKEQFLALVDIHDAKTDYTRAIHTAIEKNMKGAVIYLLHMEPHLVEAESPGGLYRPLHFAAKLGFADQVHTLLDHGAEVNSKAKKDWTPLMLAAQNGHADVVRILLESGANVLLRNKDGDNAALIAMRSGVSIPGLLPEFRHVPGIQVPRSKDPKNADKGTKLDVPKKHKGREPSPGWQADPEGELFSVSDAAVGDAPSADPKSPQQIERILSNLERTWYDKIQWSPEDDTRKSHGLDWSGPVKIAILDTGIDLDHEDFRHSARRRSKIGNATIKGLPEKPQRARIKTYKNFVGCSGEEDDVTDHVGHGTHIAGIILGIAPRAELYVAKISSGNGQANEEGARRRSRHPVQEALQWAIDQGVDIINLSLGFPYESSYELTRTLKDANDKGIIVFAAAANHGNRDAIAWPARDPELAICVTSGDDMNNLSRFAPSGNKNLPVFITHGENVCSHWPSNLGGGYRLMSGTSVSTPIAVGMAAMILAFLNTTTFWSPDQKRQWLDRSKESRLRSTRGMGRLLEYFCRDRSGLKVLSPKLLWEENPDANPLQVLSIVSQVFRLPG